MTALLGLSIFGGGQQQPVSVLTGGSTENALGGPLYRYNQISAFAPFNEPIFQSRLRLYCMGLASASVIEIHKLTRSSGSNKVRRVQLSADPAPGLPAAGETATQGGITGTLIEDYQAGDNYVLLEQITGGDFAAGAVTFSGGDSATVTSQDADNGGEWGVVFTTTKLLDDYRDQTGWHSYIRADGQLGFACLCREDVSGQAFGITFNPETETFTETGTLGSVTTFTNTARGHADADNNVIHWNIGLGIAAWNAVTNSLAFLPAGGGENYEHLHNFSGRFMSCRTRTFSQKNALHDITGGVLNSTVVDLSNYLGNEDTWTAGWLGKNENAWYGLFKPNTTNYKVDRFILQNGAVVYDGLNNFANLDDIGGKILPAALRTVGGTEYTSRFFRDVEEDETDPQHRFFLLSSANSALEWLATDVWADVAGGASATWNGTAGNTDDVVFGVAHGRSIGDHILHVGDNTSYRVTGVNSVTELTIANDSGHTIPTTSSAVKYAQTALVDQSGSITGHQYPGSARGGGNYTYTSGQYSIDILNRENSIGGEKISVKLFSDTGTDTVKLYAYYYARDNTKVKLPLLDVSHGSITGDENTGLTADNGSTTYTATFGSVPSGYQDRFVYVELDV